MTTALALALSVLPTTLQEPAPGPVLELEGLDGTVRTRPAEGFSTRDPREEGAWFVRFVHAGAVPPTQRDNEQRVDVVFLGGDRLSGWIEGGEGDELTLKLTGEASLTLLIDDVKRLVWPARLARDGGAQPVAAEEGDRLYRKSGRGLDRIDGLVSRFVPAGVVFESRLGERTYPWGEVAALFIEDLEGASAGESEPENDTRLAVVATLRGGGRLGGSLIELSGTGLRLAAGSDPDLLLPAHVLDEVAVDDGRYRFLSELEPSSLGPLSPWGEGDDVGLSYPPVFDAAVDGRPLRAGGRTWSRGLGVHAPSRITWKLDGGWKELRAKVAVDDQVLEAGNRLGSVVFRVLVDGEAVWESPVARGGQPPVELPRIPLVGARELVLLVDPIDDHVRDRADWLRPMLVRE